MRTWLIAGVACTAACIVDEHRLDMSPDAIDWADFTGTSTTQRITGTDRRIRLGLEATKTGAPMIEYRLDDAAWTPFSSSSSTTVIVEPDTEMQFRVLGTGGDSALITVSNLSWGSRLVDMVKGTAEGMAMQTVTGDGSVGAPYTAPGSSPTSCATFLSTYPGQTGRDGIYHLQPIDAYCDMTTDGRGWTLVARVLSTSTTHVTAAAFGALSSPTQPATAKYADTTINALGFTTARIRLEGTGTVYAKVSSLDLSGAAFSLPNTSAPVVAGPFTHTFVAFTTCSSDCGIAVVSTDMGFGRMCGYRYYASSGNPRPGMGCQGAPGKNGTLWVR